MPDFLPQRPSDALKAAIASPGAAMTEFYDAENNFIHSPGAMLTEIGPIRLRVAAEFMRTKVCSIDQALDDADTALGFLLREGILTLPCAKGRLESPEVKILRALRSLGWDVVRRNGGLGQPDLSQSVDHD